MKWNNLEIERKKLDEKNYIRCCVPECRKMIVRMTCHTVPIDEKLAGICDFHFEQAHYIQCFYFGCRKMIPRLTSHTIPFGGELEAVCDEHFERENEIERGIWSRKGRFEKAWHLEKNMTTEKLPKLYPCR